MMEIATPNGMNTIPIRLEGRIKYVYDEYCREVRLMNKSKFRAEEYSHDESNEEINNIVVLHVCCNYF